MPALAAAGHEVVRLVRRAPRRSDERSWDPEAGGIDPAALAGCDAGINLAGEPIDQRWTKVTRQRIESSRVVGTTQLAQALAAVTPRPGVLVSASAVGIYGDAGNRSLTESSPAGDGFLPHVVTRWEGATRAARDAGVRVVTPRFGLVLSPRGGALAKMLPLFAWGMGGPLGRRDAWWSWIALPDLVGVLLRALEDERLEGAVNAVAPEPVTVAAFARTLGHVLHRPALLPVPALALEVMFGDMARETLLASARVVPERLLGVGHRFATPTLEPALRGLLQR